MSCAQPAAMPQELASLQGGCGCWNGAARTRLFEKWSQLCLQGKMEEERFIHERHNWDWESVNDQPRDADCGKMAFNWAWKMHLHAFTCIYVKLLQWFHDYTISASNWTPFSAICELKAQDKISCTHLSHQIPVLVIYENSGHRAELPWHLGQVRVEVAFLIDEDLSDLWKWHEIATMVRIHSGNQMLFVVLLQKVVSSSHPNIAPPRHIHYSPTLGHVEARSWKNRAWKDIWPKLQRSLHHHFIISFCIFGLPTNPRILCSDKSPNAPWMD